MQRRRYMLLGLLVFGCIAAAFLILQFHQAQLASIREEQGNALSAIVSIKVTTLASLRQSRLADARVIATNPAFVELVREALRRPEDSSNQRGFRKWCDELKKQYRYSQIMLFDAHAKLIFSSDPPSPALDRESTREVTEAIRQREILYEDFHSVDGNTVHLATVAPLYDERKALLGLLLMRINPYWYFYRQIQTWPTPSPSGEILLVRREGDEIVYLNELRHRKNTALKLRFPVSRRDLTSVQAVLGRKGVFEGKDYRGVDVLAAADQIPHSPWYLIAKIDQAEAYARVRARTQNFAAVILLLLILSVCSASLVWSRSESRHYRQLYDLEARARALSSHYQYLHRYANDIILLLDENGRIVEANERATEVYGYPRDRLLGLTIHDLRHPSDRASLETQWAAAGSPTGIIFESRHMRADGSILAVEVSSRTIQVDKRMFRQSIIRDITERKRVETALRAAHQELTTIYANAPVDILMVDEELRVQKVNEVAATFAGRDTSEMIGVRPGNSIGCLNALADSRGCGHGPTCDRCPLRASVIDSVCNGTRQEGIEAWLPMIRDGRVRRRCLLVSTAPLVLEDKRKALICVQDITPLREAELELQRQHQILEQQARLINLSHDAIITADVNRTITAWNSGATETYGWTEQEAIGRPIDSILRMGSATKAAEIDAVLRRDQRWDGKVTHIRRDGRKIVVDSRRVLVKDEREIIIGILEINRDITEREKAEEEIRQLNAELEQRVRHRTAQLEVLNRELESFAYSVSHDLSAPLRGIDGWSLALLEDYESQLDSQGRQYLSRVRAETARMKLLIEDLLKLSRITQAEMDFEPVDLTGLAETIATRLRESHVERRLEFVIQPGLTVSGDPRLLDIALTNLLENAVKYTGRCALARIEFGLDTRRSEPAFYIRDNGVGFDMAHAGTLFGAFQRLHHAREFPGTGIGLATVQRVIRRHGGRIWAEAQPDQGATFYFMIGETNVKWDHSPR